MNNNTSISIITAVFNRVEFISDSIKSVQGQFWEQVEHVVIDGGSTDGTCELIKDLLHENYIYVSEPDNGIYDALNKGLALATGDVIGLLHSDDFFPDASILSDVAKVFSDPEVNLAFGDLDYVNRHDTSVVVRRWHSGEFLANKIKKGWMPPHPTLFMRRELVERLGGFDESFLISADYDLILRYFLSDFSKSVYIPRVLVKMRTGGASNKSLKNILRKSTEDLMALHKNGFSLPGSAIALLLKNLSKINQFFIK